MSAISFKGQFGNEKKQQQRLQEEECSSKAKKGNTFTQHRLLKFTWQHCVVLRGCCVRRCQGDEANLASATLVTLM